MTFRISIYFCLLSLFLTPLILSFLSYLWWWSPLGSWRLYHVIIWHHLIMMAKGKKEKDVRLTCRYHLNHIVSDSILWSRSFIAVVVLLLLLFCCCCYCCYYCLVFFFSARVTSVWRNGRDGIGFFSKTPTDMGKIEAMTD